MRLPARADRPAGVRVIKAGRCSRGEGGFTLIEVVLAVTIIGFITTILWGSFSQMVTNKQAVEAAQDRTHTARVALLRMAREIEMAFLSDAENVALPDRRTLFVGEAHSDIHELRFSSFAHQRLWEDAAEADTSVVSYFGERDREDRSVLNLMRRETRRLQPVDPKTVAGETYVLCPNVSMVQFSFYDHKKREWQETWTTLGADGAPYLPTAVRITLTLTDERGVDIAYQTEARIQMTERVAYRPVRQ